MIVSKIIDNRKHNCETITESRYSFTKISFNTGNEVIYVVTVPTQCPIDNMFAGITGVCLGKSTEKWIYHYDGKSSVQIFTPTGEKSDHEISEKLSLDSLHESIRTFFSPTMQEKLVF